MTGLIFTVAAVLAGLYLAGFVAAFLFLSRTPMDRAESAAIALHWPAVVYLLVVDWRRDRNHSSGGRP